jgi:hypothetical protein
MKILLQNIERDPVTGSYSFASRNNKQRQDFEDCFFELPKTTRFRKDPRRSRKVSHRVDNFFRDEISLMLWYKKTV